MYYIDRSRPWPTNLAQGDTVRSDFVQRTAVNTYASSRRLQEIGKNYQPKVPYPQTGLSNRLKLAAQLIDADPTENNESVMAEDCLSLNVWTPRTEAGKRPVMVWIHGGAFVVGSSRNTFYDGANLAARGDMVVVSAGREFKEIAINPMGELLMATPALSGGVMYVRTARSLFAVGKPAGQHSDSTVSRCPA